MTVTAFEGPAGTGKTHSLIDHLGGRMREQPLASQERVLALTFIKARGSVWIRAYVKSTDSPAVIRR